MPNILDRAKGSLTVMVIFICKKKPVPSKGASCADIPEYGKQVQRPWVVSAYGIQETIGSSGQME